MTQTFRRVILESPLAGDFRTHIMYAQRALGDCLFRGEAPLASHLLYPMVLNEADPIQRAQGIAAGHAWIPWAELVVAYVDYGVSTGMRAGLDLAEAHGVPVEYRYIGSNAPGAMGAPGPTK